KPPQGCHKHAELATERGRWIHCVRCTVAIHHRRAGWITRYSGPPFSCGTSICEAKTVGMPSRVNLKISRPKRGGMSAIKSLPALSKVRPRGLGRPEAKVRLTPRGVNLRIRSLLPGNTTVDTKRLPNSSKASPIGQLSELVKASGPTNMLRVPSGVNL